jgi:hypothetical protein
VEILLDVVPVLLGEHLMAGLVLTAEGRHGCTRANGCLSCGRSESWSRSGKEDRRRSSDEGGRWW